MEFLGICLLPIGGRKEKETYDTLKALSRTVVKSVKKFREGIEAYSELDFERGEDLLEEVDELESEADKHGYKFESQLREGAFLPAFRGDLSKLAETIDDIADMAEESIREVHRRPKMYSELAEAEEENKDVKSVRDGLVDLASKAVDSAEVMNDAVVILMDDMDGAAEKAEEVHRRERDSDLLEDELVRTLYEYEELLDPITIMQIRGLIEKFGAISDAAENSGDLLSATTDALKA